MFPSMSNCANTQKKIRSVEKHGHLWFFLLSRLLSNYCVDSNETCLLGLPRCLVVQAPNQILVGRQISHFRLPAQTKWNVPFVTLLSHLLWNRWTEWTAMLRVHYQSHGSWTSTCLFSVASVSAISANRKMFMFMSHTLQASVLKYIHESLDVKYSVQLSA